MSHSLPATAYIKMIDIWLIFTIIYPFAVITLFTVKELIAMKIEKSARGMFVGV